MSIVDEWLGFFKGLLPPRPRMPWEPEAPIMPVPPPEEEEPPTPPPTVPPTEYQLMVFLRQKEPSARITGAKVLVDSHTTQDLRNAGNYETRLPSGTYKVQATHPSYEDAAGTAIIRDKNTAVTMYMTPHAVVSKGVTVVRVLWDPNWEGATVEERTHLRTYYRLIVRLYLGGEKVHEYAGGIPPSTKPSGEQGLTYQANMRADQVEAIASILPGGKLIHPWASGWDLTIYTLEKDPLRIRIDGHARKSLI